MLLLSKASDSFAQFITVALVFVLVLVLALYFTKLFARSGGRAAKGARRGNLEVIEAVAIGGGKTLELVRATDRYFVVALGKDTVTLLGEVPADSVQSGADSGGTAGTAGTFKSLLERLGSAGHGSEPEEED